MKINVSKSKVIANRGNILELEGREFENVEYLKFLRSIMPGSDKDVK